MAIAIGAPSFVAETTRTTGSGAYFTDRRLPRCARISEIYSPGDTFDYLVDDGGGIAEFARGILNVDGSISRSLVHWTSSGGVGGAPISWGSGKRSIRVYAAAGTSVAVAAPVIHGFWPGTVGSSEKIERYLFAQMATLPAGMPGSLATAGTPNAATAGNFFVDELGNSLVDELGNFLVDGVGGDAAVFDILKNGVSIGSMAFGPGQTNAVFSLASSVSFAVGDVLELVGPASAGAISDLMWAIQVGLDEAMGSEVADILAEAAARQAADNFLQAQIDALASSPPGGGVPVGAIMLISPVYAQDLDTSSGPQTYTLRVAQDDGEQWRVKDATGNAQTNPITVTAGGVILLDGASTALINQAFQGKTFRWNATMGKWLIE